MSKRRFPFVVDLEQCGREKSGRIGKLAEYWPLERYWFIHQERHHNVIEWLRENVGDRCVNWYCKEAGYYYLKLEEDVMAFKLRWL